MPLVVIRWSSKASLIGRSVNHKMVQKKEMNEAIRNNAATQADGLILPPVFIHLVLDKTLEKNETNTF